MTNKTVMIMAGGTGGHVFPALAVADALAAKGYSIHWLGTAAGIEADVIPKAGYPLHCIQVTGLRGKGKLALLAAPFKILKAIYQAWRFMKVIQADAVLGLGGFATGPGGVAAKLMGIPLLIHEQNAFPGMTNRLLKPMSNVVMQAFANTFKGNHKKEIAAGTFLTTGNPVRANIVELKNNSNKIKSAHVNLEKTVEATAAKTEEKTADFTKEKLNVLVVGGSLGAIGINNAVIDALALVQEKETTNKAKYSLPNLWHQVGKKNIEQVQQLYASKGLSDKAKVVAFIDDMAAAYEWADLVICRSGALTVSELACAGKASILIPFPHAADDHQTANAQTLVDAGGAELKQQSELTGEWLAQRWQHYVDNPQHIKTMSLAASSASITNATDVVAEQVIKQIRLND